MLKIFNTLTNTKSDFTPIKKNHISIYVCGMTVYDYCHIGHARSLIVFDCIVRYLRFRGYTVTYVRNITDIDDKIINRANENNEPIAELTERFINAMHEDEQALSILSPDHEPRATEYMQEMQKLIQELLDENFAYVADNGDVNFSVRNFKGYGKLSRRELDDLISGARVHIAESKRDPLDFALWKLSKNGEPAWQSPWGDGRPGWHIECSAMSTALLGQPFDIHGGGMDLKFPHHENEIAQSESIKPNGFANLWMHVGLLMVNKEKMSKSLGNFHTIRDVIAKHHPEVIRYFMISGHYRSPVNYTEETLTQIRASLEKMYSAIRGLPSQKFATAPEFLDKFQAAMDDDFNTPVALSVLFEMVHEINRFREKNDLAEAANLATVLKQLANLFGLLQQDSEEFLRGKMSEEFSEKIAQLISQRNQARAEKNWQRADEIRNELTALGVAIEDSSQGTTWRKL